jgi:2-(1,2-epoxy-1,2-dihydrophenyl)acetyl-CoA isomerase
MADSRKLPEERHGAVAVVRLSRPETLNALDRELVDALGDALERLGADADVRAVVVTGSGGAFCSGVDLKEAMSALGRNEALGERLAGFHRLIRLITRADKPFIAAVDGAAVGFGADLALACDLRVLSARAYLQEKFVNIGLMPDGGGTFHLPRMIGVGRALELMLLGERVDAELAKNLGLANRVVDVDALEPTALELAQKLAAGPPLALAAIKRAVRANLSATLDDALDRERDGQLALLRSSDLVEGVSAWTQQRSPVFRGR